MEDATSNIKVQQTSTATTPTGAPSPDGGAVPPTPPAKPEGETEDKGKQPFAVFPDADSFMTRVKREAKKEVEGILKELGFENQAALKKAVEAVKAAEEASKTEGERQAERLAQLQKERDEALANATKRLIRAECQRLAQDLGFAHPELAHRLVDGLDAMKLSDDEQVEGLEEALKTLSEKYPDLLKPKIPAAPSIAATKPASQTQQGETDAERRKRYFGGQQGPFWQGGGATITEK